MTTSDTEKLQPPETPEAFESLCVDLFKEIWGDPSVQKNARRGQKQNGVDLFGTYQGRRMGVQCKQKSGQLHTKVTAAELKDEVEDAKKFKPRLDTFILATSGITDGPVQEAARVLSEGGDPSFKVEVWSWDKLWHELHGNESLLQRIQPIYWSRTGGQLQRIAPSRLTHTAPQLFGRERPLAELDTAWNNDGTNVVSIIAWGGVGKTCLVASWVAQLASRKFDGADYFDWSFYSQGTRDSGSATSDAFVAKALEFFGDEETARSTKSAWDKGSRLAEISGRRRALLVLDGLEPLQYPKGPMDGELKDPAIEALLKGLAARNAGLCVVTSRAKLTRLQAFQGGTAPELNLRRLSTAAGEGLLRSLGVIGTTDELQTLVNDVGGHALTLNLLGRFLHLAHNGDVRCHDQVDLQEADDTSQDGHAFRAMEVYANWLDGGGEKGRRQLAVLRLLGLFDRPASASCLEALRKEPAIPGVTDELVGLAHKDWNVSVRLLEEAKLLVRGPDDSLDAHPLIREYFADRLREDNEDSWKAAHGRLFDHLQASTEHQPDTLEGLQPLYQAVAHGCLAGREQEACKVYADRISRGPEAYVIKKLGAFGADLGAVACFFEQPWSRVASTFTEALQADLLSRAAFRLRALGRLRESVEPMRAALHRDVEQESWEEAAMSSNNLSQLLLTLGDIEGAVHDGEQAVDFADRSEERMMRIINRTALADALHQAGRRAEALESFQEAEVMQVKEQRQYPLLYSVQGFRYCDLLLTDAERAAHSRQGVAGAVDVTNALNAHAIAACREIKSRAIQTFVWAKENQVSTLDVALQGLTLGRARLFEAVLNVHDPSEASTEIEAAVDGLRRSGHSSELPKGLLTRAWLRALTDEPDGACADLNEAWEIAERGPMPLFQADVLLHRARLFEDRAALKEARRLIDKHGYGRRLGELEDAEAWLGTDEA